MLEARPETVSELSDVVAYLGGLRQTRPSRTLAANRSARGVHTIRTILKASRVRFAESGHDGLTVRDVAALAGLSPSNVSYYFPTKSDLLTATLREELIDYVDEHLAHFHHGANDPLEILLNVIEFYISSGRRSHRFFVQMRVYAAIDDRAREIVRDLYRAIGRFIHQLVQAANPSLSDARARQITLQLFSLEEGVKLFIGMGPETDQALGTVERDLRDLARRIVLEG